MPAAYTCSIVHRTRRAIVFGVISTLGAGAVEVVLGHFCDRKGRTDERNELQGVSLQTLSLPLNTVHHRSVEKYLHFRFVFNTTAEIIDVKITVCRIFIAKFVFLGFWTNTIERGQFIHSVIISKPALNSPFLTTFVRFTCKLKNFSFFFFFYSNIEHDVDGKIITLTLVLGRFDKNWSHFFK